ncbi:hypothetical protein ACFOOM_22965 [Streptomyces echinoruber]|uniref:Uncharacterized protein n=1 Tax=Streptomyces echinoruber TaxID=68898 RepID=A0A918VA49_9ACTN|nr:hypothetical protein [Streptomyces echinoruber]GGZ83061.1 hypothetical protein GCM10010389_21390 [Streptomyces echinoruber]
MSERNTVLRSLHDLGLAAWFGGSLMGAVGLNGAVREKGVPEVTRRQVESTGWAKWTPVNAAAIGIHLVGGAGLLRANAGRVVGQRGVGASTLAKTVLTGAALAATAYSRVLGKKVEQVSSTAGDENSTGPAADLNEVQESRRKLTLLQWAVPALTGGLLVLNALHGEQQRPGEQSRGMLQRAMGPLQHLVDKEHSPRC